MASITCPNTSHPNYQLARRVSGKENALYLFDFYGRIPDLEEIMNYTQRAEGYSLRDDNNPAVWDIENKEGLSQWRSIDGERKKKYNRLYKVTANRRASELSKLYPHATFSVHEVELDSLGDVKKRFIIKTSIPLENTYTTAAQRLKEEEFDEALARDSRMYEQRIDDDKLSKEDREDFELKKAVMLKTFPFVKNVIEDYEISVAGLVEEGGNVIRVNPRYWTKDTIGHEFAHVLIDSIGGLSNPLVAKGIELLRDSDIWRTVEKRYPDLVESSDDRFEKEVLAEAIGRETVSLFEESKLPAYQRWLNQFIRKLKDFFGFDTESEVTQLARKVISGTPITDRSDVGYNEKRTYTHTDAELLDEDLKGKAEEESKKLSTIETLRNKIREALKRKFDIYSKKKRGLNKDRLEKILKDINKEDADPIEALRNFQEYAYTQTQAIYAEYKKIIDTKGHLVKEGDAYGVSLKQLSRWNDYVNGFNALEDLSEFAFKLETYLKDNDQLSKFRKVIDPAKIKKTLEMKNEIRGFYLQEGKLQVAKFLAPHSKHIIAQFKEKYEREFFSGMTRSERKATTSKELRQKKETFIEEKLAYNEKEISNATENAIAGELNKAGKDVGYLTRWIDNVLDSPDMVVSAMVDAFQDTTFNSRQEKRELHLEYLEIVKDLEGLIGNTGITGDLSKAYNFMLERDEYGNLTNQIITPYRSSMWESFNAFKSRVNNIDWTDKEEVMQLVTEGHLEEYEAVDILNENMLDVEAIQSAMSSWKNENVPMSKKKRSEFEKAREKYIESLVKDGKLDKKEINKLKEYVSGRRYFIYSKKGEVLGNTSGYTNYKAAKFDSRKVGQSGTRVGKKELNDYINAEASELYIDWLRKNTWDYREPIQAWINPQYDKLMSLADSDPRKRYYKFITENLDKVQKNLPPSNRLLNRLPGLVKSTGERITAEDNTLGTSLGHAIRSSFNVMADETERGVEQITDEEGNKVSFVPVYYTNDLTSKYKEAFDELKANKKESLMNDQRIGYANMPKSYKESISLEEYTKSKYATKQSMKDQSFDLATSYYKYFSSAIDYKHKQEILPQMEMARYLVGEREVTVTNNKGLAILRKGSTEEVEPKLGKESRIYGQLNDWFESMMYGKKEIDSAKILNGKVDVGKLANFVNRFTSLNLLGMNFVQGTANIILGETMQTIEALGKEYFSAKDLFKARTLYMKNMAGIVGDVGRRHPKNVINLLNLEFDTLHEYEGDVMRDDTKFRQMMSSNTLFFTTHVGEHYMQTAVMLAMLDRVQAKVGDEIVGTMKQMAKVKNGKLVFETDDGRAITNWDNKARSDFGKKMKRVLSSIHGEYSEEGRTAIQRYAAGRLIMMFRKFIVTGFRRRYGKKNVNNLLGENKEGYYLTGATFFKNIYKDLFALRWSLVSTNWNSMLDSERANVRKMLAEVSFILASVILGNLLVDMEGDDEEQWRLDFLTYQALRFKAELLFFMNIGETMKILRSPAAAMSMVETSIKFFGQLLDFVPAGFEFEEYERGNWKGKKKITKTMVDYLPVIKQAYRLKNVDDQLSWMKN